MSVFRAFVAVDLPEDVLEQLDQVLRLLRENIGDKRVRWVPVENLHLTLKFLGDVSRSNVDVLREIIENVVAAHKEFAFSVGGVGAFPSPLRARVIWAGVQAPPELMAVQRSIDVETARLGYRTENRPFKPHLTLGRVTRNAGPKDVQHIASALKEIKVGFLGVVPVKEIRLFQSNLQPNGAVYARVFSVPLTKKAVK